MEGEGRRAGMEGRVEMLAARARVVETVEDVAGEGAWERESGERSENFGLAANRDFPVLDLSNNAESPALMKIERNTAGYLRVVQEFRVDKALVATSSS
jgi:hypothetical protein